MSSKYLNEGKIYIQIQSMTNQTSKEIMST